MVAVPVLMPAGRTFSVQEPPPTLTKFRLAAGTKSLLEDVAVTIKLAAAVSTSFTVNGIEPVSIAAWVDLFDKALMVGRSFTGVTMNWNEEVSVFPRPSFTERDTVLVPERLLFGVMTKVRDEPVPLTTMEALSMLVPAVTLAVKLRLTPG